MNIHTLESWIDMIRMFLFFLSFAQSYLFLQYVSFNISNPIHII